jgi:hypothetical protein
MRETSMLLNCCTCNQRQQIHLWTWVTLPSRSVYPIELERKVNLIHEHEWTGNTVTGICKKI